jgi:hypothetical protein
MHILVVYACTVAILISLPRFNRLWPSSPWGSSAVKAIVLKYGILPTILRRRQLIGPVTRVQLVTHILYGAGTLACNLAGVQNRSGAVTRTGSLSVLHLVLVLVTDHPSLTADTLAIPLADCHRLIRSLAWMAMLQALAHVAVILSGKTPLPDGVRPRSGIAVCLVQPRAPHRDAC